MRIAFVGGSGHHFLRRLVGHEPGLEVAIVADAHDPAASATMGAALPGAKRFDDVATMAASFRPDVVSVGTVYGHLGDATAACLERDLAVVTDKPAAATWRQFERLSHLCERSGRPLITEFDFRVRPAFRAARRAVRENLVGEVAL
ncbi:MAG TPA: Gfo/Idh/MocA family oxidoreductase, partial [Tepidisphaeraceae bacterium]|nr:Gfo/Idh/MocA family oxidoreductase [Tepidisphaeraceae bacterium]